MKVKILSDYRKLMAMYIPQEVAIHLAASTIIEGEIDSDGDLGVIVPYCGVSNATWHVFSNCYVKVD